MPEGDCVTTAVVQQEVVDNASEDFMSALGEDPSTMVKKGQALHDGIVNRWNYFLKKGLDKETIKSLLLKYPPASNCDALIPPQLNDEIRSCLPDSDLKQDKYLEKLQEELSAGLSALAIPINSIIEQKEGRGFDKAIFSHLAEAAKMVANVYFQLSVHRKFLINPHLSPTFKKAMEDSEINQFLYGDKLLEKVKALQSAKSTARTVKAAGRTLIPASIPRPSNWKDNSNLNFQRRFPKGKMKPNNNNNYNNDKREDRTPKNTSRNKKYYYSHRRRQ